MNIDSIFYFDFYSNKVSNEFPIEEFRKNFPILGKSLKNDKKLIYLDNFATTQKPRCVVDKIVDFYLTYNSNVHRGIYEFGEFATAEYEKVRANLAQYIGISNPSELIFVRGTTEAINLVAHSYVRKFLSAGDEILVGEAEHHSNYVPWQIVANELGISLRIIPLCPSGDIDIELYKKMFSRTTKLVAIQHISNVLGTVNNVKLLTDIAHEHGAKILIDGACSLSLERPNLKIIDCDFFACSGHKSFGPTGVGFLYGKYDLLCAMSPYQTGGNTVNKVSQKTTTFRCPPDKFEAGTPDIAAVIGFGETLRFLGEINWEAASLYLLNLTNHTVEKLRSLDGVILYGNPIKRIGAVSFNIKDVHSHDVAAFLAQEGIFVRAGTHCAQPLMQFLKTPGTVRLSLSLYNTEEELDFVSSALGSCFSVFA